jgi:transcriptional regulator GlxA family with amidase domain
MKHLSILVPDEQTNMSTIACIIGAYQIVSEANNYLARKNEKPIFKMELVGATQNDFLTNNFLSIKHQVAIHEINKTHLIIIPASLIRSYDTATANNKRLIDWVTKQYKQGAEIASMCAGSFMLASTGILSGKTCSTHWALSEGFRALHPDVNLQTDQLITDESGIYTNGGAYSFLNLMLYLVEKFYDRPTAIHCAKYFQIDLDRNMQAEFSIFSGHKKHDDEAILKAQNYLEAHYQDKISVEDLSRPPVLRHLIICKE